MKTWVDLRSQFPYLFTDIKVYQQPAAWMDEIVTAWSIEELQERCPQCVHQRDLFGSALADVNKKKMQLAHQIPTWIAGKMTPVLQLTDTDLAHPMKAAAQAAKKVIAHDMRIAGQINGQKPTFTCGPKQMMQIAIEAHR